MSRLYDANGWSSEEIFFMLMWLDCFFPHTDCYANEVQYGEVEDGMLVWKEDAAQNTPSIGEQLSQQPKMEMIWFLGEFRVIFQDVPGKKT